MRKRAPRALSIVLFVVLALVAIACGGSDTGTAADGGEATAGGGEATAGGGEATAPAEGPAEPVGSMVLGTGIDAAYGSIVAGVREGFFEKHGVDAELRVFSSGQESLEATLTGQSDFSGNGQYNVPFVAAQGGNVRIIAEYERSDEQFGAVAAEGIEGPEDLVGKRVATQFGTSPDYYFRLYAEHYGLDLNQVEYVDLQFAQLIPALSQGDIDAFFAFEPLLTNAMESVPGATILHRSGEDDVMPLRVFSVVSERVYSDPDLAVAFLRGLIEAGEWSNEHPDEVAAMIAEEFEMELEDAERYVSYFDYSVEFSEESLAELERVTEYVAERGLVDQAPDLSQFVDTSFFEQATQ
jgi:NitT/TauT family transport system substrate-binding protein